MDEVKLSAQQRFDLIDMTRFQGFIHTAFRKIRAQVLGAATHFKGTSGDYLNKKVLVAVPFYVTAPGTTLTFTVERTWTAVGNTVESAVYDKDGYRIGGPNSASSKTLLVSATPGCTNRYINIRRVVTADTNEPRKFYDTTSGKNIQNVDTRQIDDWEIAEHSAAADGDATLRDAGWISLTTFQTNGTDDITTFSQMQTTFEKSPLSWAISPPGVDDPALYYAGVAEYIAALRQLIARMRAGKGSRDWHDDPSNEAAFDEQGGIRFGHGDDQTGGPSGAYLRALGSQDIITAYDGTASGSMSESDLKHIMGAGIFARDIDPGNHRGHLYQSSPGSETAETMTKSITYGFTSFWPANDVSNSDPYLVKSAPATYPNDWLRTGDGWSTHYNYATNGSSSELICDLQPLQGLRIGTIILHLTTITAFDGGDDLSLETSISSRSKVTNGQTVHKSSSWVYSSGAPFNTAAYGNVIIFDSIGGGDTEIDIQNTLAQYYVKLYLSASSDPFLTGQIIDVHGLTVIYQIREASHEF